MADASAAAVAASPVAAEAASYAAAPAAAAGPARGRGPLSPAYAKHWKAVLDFTRAGGAMEAGRAGGGHWKAVRP